MHLQGFRAAVLAVVVYVGLVAVGQTPAVATGPVVSSFSPASGTIGTTVTITGSGFTGATKVMFNTAKSRFTVKSASKITAIVPTSASTGPIRVTTPGGTAASAKKFTVKPSIVLSVSSGPPTTTVKVLGAGFGALEAVDIYFDTTDEALASASATGTFSGVAVGVPASAVPGTHHVTAVGRHSGFSAQAPFLVNTNWTQFRYSTTHTGTNPYENVLSPSSVSGLALDWSFSTGGGVQSSPAVVNGVVYIGSNDGNVYALNAATGAKLWSFTTGSAGLSESSPAVVKGVVYIGSNGGNVYALNAATGAKLWSFTTGNAVQSSPAVTNGVVYIGSEDGHVYALKAATGAKLWSFTATGNNFVSSPAVVKGVVYIGSYSGGSMYALNAATGAKLWSFTTGNFVQSSPAVVNGVVYVGSLDGNVYALNASTGTKVWSATTSNFVVSSPAVANGVVYVGSDDGNVYAFHADTGARLWSFNTSNFVVSSPAVANGVVYVGSNGGTVGYDVYALNASTGAQLWNFTTGDAFQSSPAVANGVVYVGSEDGNMYSFHLPGGPQPAVGQGRAAWYTSTAPRDADDQ